MPSVVTVYGGSSVHWDFLVVQEFGRVGGEKEYYDNHVCYMAPPSGAWQRCAIAVHESLGPSVVGSPQSHGRAMYLDLQLDVRGYTRVITIHMFLTLSM